MTTSSGIALLCNLEGVIVDVLRNSPELKIPAQPGLMFTRLVAGGSLAKALTFLTDLQAQGAVFDHEINVTAGAEIKTLRFVGGQTGEHLLICGSENGGVAQALYAEMVRINNEQTNTLRDVFKERSRSDTLYDEISRLNNELVAMQREAAKKNAELQRLNQEKNRFLGMAAHDLRNPLHTILSYSDYLIERAEDAEQQEFLQVIHTVSHFMARLVDDLLDVAQIEAGELKLEYDLVKLPELIKRNVAINRPLAARRQIELIYELDETLPPAVVDGAKIEQVLNNLISNAIKFSQPQSSVTVRLQRDGAHFLLSVIDHGVGISPEQQLRLFQPFQRGQRGAEGEASTGLGLVIVKRIVEGHGGSIYFESEVGRGTTFFVSIPLQPPDVEGDAA